MNANTLPGSPLIQAEVKKALEGMIKAPLTGREVPAQKSNTAQGPASEKTDKKAPGAFRTISEVADDLAVQQHVLRFWETKFSQIRPLKRGGGRRYYRPEDLVLLKKIHHLLYTEGYTIKGVQKLLKERGKAFVLEDAPQQPQNNNQPAATSSAQTPARDAKGLNAAEKDILEATLADLKDIRKLVNSD